MITVVSLSDALLCRLRQYFEIAMGLGDFTRNTAMDFKYLQCESSTLQNMVSQLYRGLSSEQCGLAFVQLVPTFEGLSSVFAHIHNKFSAVPSREVSVLLANKQGKGVNTNVFLFADITRSAYIGALPDYGITFAMLTKSANPITLLETLGVSNTPVTDFESWAAINLDEGDFLGLQSFSTGRPLASVDVLHPQVS